MADESEPSTDTVAVYACRDQHGAICFVGRTRNVERRKAEHAARGWSIEHVLHTDADKARDVEQAVINRLGHRESS